MKIMKRLTAALLVLVLVMGTAGAETTPGFKYPFGVILNVCDDLEQFGDYETIRVLSIRIEKKVNYFYEVTTSD